LRCALQPRGEGFRYSALHLYWLAGRHHGSPGPDRAAHQPELTPGGVEVEDECELNPESTEPAFGNRLPADPARAAERPGTSGRVVVPARCEAPACARRRARTGGPWAGETAQGSAGARFW